MPRSVRPAAEGDPVRPGFGRKHTILILAGTLTVAMLGWQGWHIYNSYQAVAHKESGKCATKLVEEVYFSATLHGNQFEDLEHAISASTPIATAAGIPAWEARFAASGQDLSDRIEASCEEISGALLLAVQRVEAARIDFDSQAETLTRYVAGNDLEAAREHMTSAAFTSDHDEYITSVDGLVSETRKHLEVQLGVERRSELTSVTVAFGIFALALGAWGLFLRRIRSDQLRLAEEEHHRRAAEEDLMQAQKLDAMGNMAGEIAHDFNNLVTAIWGSATSAREHLDEDHPAVVPIRRIEEASEQANDVVRGLLAFGRRTPARLEPVEMGTLVWETGSLLQSMIPDSVELVVEAAPGGSRWVNADRTQLQQVLINMVLNARDAMPDGGRLTVCTRCAPGPEDDDLLACLEVADSGHGMTPDVQARIFEPFFTTREESGRGTGLGLAIVHGIVTNHGGTISVESAPGKGSRFTVLLPTIEPPEETPAPDVDQVENISVTGAAVLLTEDHRQVREIMTETLEDSGYTVTQASTGYEMLDAFAIGADRFDALIVDLDIPGPDGIECLQRLRSQGVATPAVLVTGTGAPDIEERVGNGTTVLRKPFPMVELRRVVADLIEGAVTEQSRG